MWILKHAMHNGFEDALLKGSRFYYWGFFYFNTRTFTQLTISIFNHALYSNGLSNFLLPGSTIWPYLTLLLGPLFAYVLAYFIGNLLIKQPILVLILQMNFDEFE